MTAYPFHKVSVYDQLGGVVRLARNSRINVTDPDTGLVAAGLTQGGVSVQWVTTDAFGTADFTSTLPTVQLTAPNGLTERVTSSLAIELAANAGVSSDAAIKTAISNPAAQSGSYLNATYETGAAKIVYVSPSGNDSRNGKTWSTAKATIAAAMTEIGAGNAGTIILDFGTHLVGPGLSMSGCRLNILGRGAGHTTTDPARCVIKAETQTGPVLDFTGYLWPDSFRGRVEFGGFSVEGSNVADPTKNNAGVRVATPTSAAGSAYFHDIAISRTGGPGLDLGAVYLSDFDRITIMTPVSAKANDVPYMQAVGANGNRFRGIGFRSMSSSADVGPSGVLVMSPGGGFAPHDNVFDAPWFEFLHVPTNGCIVSIAGNANVFQNPQFFDCSKETGATGTAWARFLVPTGTGVANLGGNMWRGYVPGKGTNATSLDLGIDVQQSGNSIIGTKGYRGTNVQLAAGVNNTHALLTGSESAPTDAAFVDNSGAATNLLIDQYLRTERHGSYIVDERTAGNGGAGPRFQDPVTPANGAFWLGTSGTRVQAIGASAYYNADVFNLRDVAQTAGKLIRFDLSFRPGMTLPDHGALPAATSGLRGKVVVVQGAAGVADQFYICRKNSADAYEWAQLTV